MHVDPTARRHIPFRLLRPWPFRWHNLDYKIRHSCVVVDDIIQRRKMRFVVKALALRFQSKCSLFYCSVPLRSVVFAQLCPVLLGIGSTCSVAAVGRLPTVVGRVFHDVVDSCDDEDADEQRANSNDFCQQRPNERNKPLSFVQAIRNNSFDLQTRLWK